MTVRPESSIAESGEIASGVAIAASVSEISDSSCRSDHRLDRACMRNGLENAAGRQATMASEA